MTWGEGTDKHYCRFHISSQPLPAFNNFLRLLIFQPTAKLIHYGTVVLRPLSVTRSLHQRLSSALFTHGWCLKRFLELTGSCSRPERHAVTSSGNLICSEQSSALDHVVYHIFNEAQIQIELFFIIITQFYVLSFQLSECKLINSLMFIGNYSKPSRKINLPLFSPKQIILEDYDAVFVREDLHNWVFCWTIQMHIHTALQEYI